MNILLASVTHCSISLIDRLPGGRTHQSWPHMTTDIIEVRRGIQVNRRKDRVRQRGR